VRADSKIVLISTILGVSVSLLGVVLEPCLYDGSLRAYLSGENLSYRVFIHLSIVLWFVAFGYALSKGFRKIKQIESDLREKAEIFKAVAHGARDAIIIMDDRGIIKFWNPAAEAIFGYEEKEAVGKDLHSLIVPPRFYPAFESGLEIFRETGKGPAIGKLSELSAVRRDCNEFPVELSLSAVQINGRWHSIGIVRDISERKRTEEELRTHRIRLSQLVEEKTSELALANEKLREEVIERKKAEDTLKNSERFYATIFDSIRDPFCIINKDFIVVRANEAYAHLKGISLDELIGNRCYEALHNRKIVCDGCVVEKTFHSGDPCAKDKPVKNPDGSDAWVEIYTYPIFGDDLRVSHVIEYTRDITDRKRSESERKRLIERLEHLSNIDSLTGLLNRRALLERLSTEVQRAERYGTELSIALCDMDNFKEINDIYGHIVGDDVLRVVADTLRKPLRSVDAIGRYGGDEFLIILPQTSLKGAESLAERLRSLVAETGFVAPDGKRLRLSVSIGVSNSGDTNELIRKADTALYRSKHLGKNRVSAS